MKEVPLTKGLFALVDDDDFDSVSKFRWHALKRGRLFHAARTEKKNGNKRTVYMHRYLMGEPPGLEVDPRNGNGLDNTRDNLRVCTHAKNAVNHKRSSPSKSSQYHGVCWHAWSKRWRVVICAGAANGERSKQIYVGVFRDETDAARAYDRAAIQHHGEFAVTNFPRENYQ